MGKFTESELKMTIVVMMFCGACGWLTWGLEHIKADYLEQANDSYKKLSEADSNHIQTQKKVIEFQDKIIMIKDREEVILKNVNKR